MNIYERLFKMDLKMLEVRSSYNEAYKQFINSMKKVSINTEKEWNKYEELRDDMIYNTWETIMVE